MQVNLQQFEEGQSRKKHAAVMFMSPSPHLFFWDETGTTKRMPLRKVRAAGSFPASPSIAARFYGTKCLFRVCILGALG
jgi:hypothetical protein